MKINRSLYMSLKDRVIAYFTPEPQTQEEYVDRVSHLLRRDFTAKEQNEIIFSIELKLIDLRDKDILKKKEELSQLIEAQNLLKERIGLI